MVPLLNRPFLAYQLGLLTRHGISDVVLACSYRVDDVRTAVGAETQGARLRYVVEEEPLGTGGGVRHAVDEVSGAVWVLNGDILTDADLTAMRRFHQVHRARMTMFLIPVDDPRQYGVVETAADGRILRFREKPTAGEEITTNTINAGVYLLDAELLRRIPTGRPLSIEREFFPNLIADGIACFGWCPTAYWRDIGSPAAYLAAQMDLLEGRVKTSLSPPGRISGGAWLDEPTGLDPAAIIVPPAVVGRGARVAARARVGPGAVLGAGCRIGPDAQIVRSVLWEGVEVGPGAMLRDCVVGPEARIGARAQVSAGAALESGAVVADHARIPP